MQRQRGSGALAFVKKALEVNDGFVDVDVNALGMSWKIWEFLKASKLSEKMINSGSSEHKALELIYRSFQRQNEILLITNQARRGSLLAELPPETTTSLLLTHVNDTDVITAKSHNRETGAALTLRNSSTSKTFHFQRKAASTPKHRGNSDEQQEQVHLSRWHHHPS